MLTAKIVSDVIVAFLCIVEQEALSGWKEKEFYRNHFGQFPKFCLALKVTSYHKRKNRSTFFLEQIFHLYIILMRNQRLLILSLKAILYNTMHHEGFAVRSLVRSYDYLCRKNYVRKNI